MECLLLLLSEGQQQQQQQRGQGQGQGQWGGSRQLDWRLQELLQAAAERSWQQLQALRVPLADSTSLLGLPDPSETVLAGEVVAFCGEGGPRLPVGKDVLVYRCVISGAGLCPHHTRMQGSEGTIGSED